MENLENEEIRKKERQLDNLIHLTENHTRTQRHLEQYSEIGNKENKENARKIQEIREEQMDELKNKIKGINEKETPKEQLKNLKENYENTQGYIKNNKDSIDDQMLKNLQEKQQHREEQIDFLENEE